MIILANLGRLVQENCTISLAESSLSGEYKVDVILGEGAFDPIVFEEDGGLIDYQLPRDVDAWEYFILWLTQ